MTGFLTKWTVRKALAVVFSIVVLAAGIFAVMWEPEQRARGSLVLGDEQAPLVVRELADFT